MRPVYLVLLSLLLAPAFAGAQAISLNTDGSSPDPSAILDVKSTDKGVLVPRMSTAQRTAITAAEALMVFDSDTKSFWFFDSAAAAWREIRAGNIATLADADGDTKVQVEKLSDEDIIRFDLGGTESLVLRKNASGEPRLELSSPTKSNTFVGTDAGNTNTTGFQNTAFGRDALRDNTTGAHNTGTGVGALRNNTTGIENTATGMTALTNNTTGNQNTALGRSALQNNTTGQFNTANGYTALLNNLNGNYNTANGYKALLSNTNGVDNTATGSGALYSNTSGNGNTASGIDALRNNTTGSSNTANGNQALLANTIGSGNTAVGIFSLDVTTGGNFNTAIGYNTGPNNNAYSNTTCLGTDATATGSDMVRVGNTFVTSIGGKVGWTTVSDGRFKENVEANVPGLAFITRLRPVTYRVNRRAVDDFTGVSQRRSTSLGQHTGDETSLPAAPLSATTTGFIAQEVEKAADELGFAFSGVDKPKNEHDYYGLRYAEFTVPLVKAVQEQQAEIERLTSENTALKAQLDMQAAQLQKITAALLTAGINLEN